MLAILEIIKNAFLIIDFRSRTSRNEFVARQIIGQNLLNEMENILFPQKNRMQYTYIIKYIFLAIIEIEALEMALTFRLVSEIRN